MEVDVLQKYITRTTFNNSNFGLDGKPQSNKVKASNIPLRVTAGQPIGVSEMGKFFICTDAFTVEVEAETVDDAIADAFVGEMRRPPVDLNSLESRFQEIGDGAECLVRNEETGEEFKFGPY